jgi:hypothetical protein
MTVLVSDTSVIIDLERAQLIEEMFVLPHVFAVPDLLYERELAQFGGQALIDRGLRIEELSGEEVVIATKTRREAAGLSVVDAFALALAQARRWELLAGDGLLRKVAGKQGVTCRGVLWIFDQLHESAALPIEKLAGCLETLAAHPRCRLPSREIAARRASYTK